MTEPCRLDPPCILCRPMPDPGREATHEPTCDASACVYECQVAAGREATVKARLLAWLRRPAPSMGTITSIEAHRPRVDVPAEQRAAERAALVERLAKEKP